jgi:hypothetical protein
MLEEVERDSRIGIQGHDFSINKCIGREPFTGTSDLRDLLCEKVSSISTKASPRSNLCPQDNGIRQT